MRRRVFVTAVAGLLWGMIYAFVSMPYLVYLWVAFLIGVGIAFGLNAVERRERERQHR